MENVYFIGEEIGKVRLLVTDDAYFPEVWALLSVKPLDLENFKIG